MKTILEIKDFLSKEKSGLLKNFGVKEIGVFGSYTRGEENVSSDIDILVDFERPIGFLKFIELENKLSSALETKVDLVSRKALKPRIGRQIMQELIKI